MRRLDRVWVGRGVLALLVAVGANAILSTLSVEHDAALVALIAAAAVAVTTLTLGALDAGASPSWSVSRGDTAPDRGEDTRTAMYRHVIEVHLTSVDADDAIIWQIADLASKRMRQVHGVRPQDSPELARELLGPELAEWASHDRRHRYQPDVRHRRYSVAQLGEAVRRIEQL